MTTNDPRSTDVGALLTAWFEVDAPKREPDGLVDAALERTARTRPLPAWRLPERWIPMQLAMRRIDACQTPSRSSWFSRSSSPLPSGSC